MLGGLIEKWKTPKKTTKWQKEIQLGFFAALIEIYIKHYYSSWSQPIDGLHVLTQLIYTIRKKIPKLIDGVRESVGFFLRQNNWESLMQLIDEYIFSILWQM